MGINFATKCTKCGVTLGQQALLALTMDAIGNAPDPYLCPKGGGHDFYELPDKDKEPVMSEPEGE